ncbi:hypothetical protein J1C56_23190 [Aminobacter anthyllidis]|uniref:Uncharacterized protein n=1 Tax=Aminobacter anthyllidis TaxID=1035067 RepID=A0A9X1AF17_9HYPH|nr:hypothetical protein [Aminobacter anthyllidis]MBT1158503.1 hypothetical protein [Aminobacter anthyllidis]
MKAYLACRLLKPEDAGLLPLIRHLVDEQSIYGYRRITAPALRIRSPREFIRAQTRPRIRSISSSLLCSKATGGENALTPEDDLGIIRPGRQMIVTFFCYLDFRRANRFRRNKNSATAPPP